MSSLMSFSWQLSVTALSPPCVAAAAVCPSRYLQALPRCVATSRQAGRVAVRGAARPSQLLPGSECARTFAPLLATLPTPCPRRSHPYGRCSGRAAAWPRAQLRALPGTPGHQLPRFRVPLEYPGSALAGHAVERHHSGTPAPPPAIETGRAGTHRHSLSAGARRAVAHAPDQRHAR